MRGTWTKRIVLACAAIFLLACAFGAGFVASHEHLLPGSVTQQLKSSLGVFRHRDAAPDRQEINTSLLRISMRNVRIPGTEDRRGGGITLAGATLLGTTGGGEFFRLTGEKATLVDIRPPPNHFDEYKSAAASDPELAALTHDFSLFRYNAPLFVESGDQHLLFLTYTEWQPREHCYAMAVARLDLASSPQSGDLRADATDWKIIYRTRPCLPPITKHDAVQAHQGGGAMAFDQASGRLLVTAGDYRFDGVYAPQVVAQDDNTDYGKLMSLSLDGRSVEHLATGLRNPQGLQLLANGEIWETEHGPRGGDELNRIEPGKNFGWPYRTLGTRYSALPWPSPTYGHHDEGDEYVSPVFSWVPSVGIAGITKVGGFDPAWDGDFLVGSMRAQTLFRLRVTGGRVQYSEPIVMQDRIRQVLQLPDHKIALWTDSRKVIFLSPSAASRTQERAQEDIARISGGDTARARQLEAALQRCMECHSLDPEASGNSPHLFGVGGREVAATGYASYSPALRAAGGKWTRERLTAYLDDPQKFAPGTPMPDPQLAPDTLADLVLLLDGLNSPE